MLRKFFIGAALTLGALTASAATIDTAGLSDAQVAELKAIAASKVAEAAKVAGTAAQSGVKDIVTVENIGKIAASASTWGTQAATAAEGFARALGIAAKELGLTINDFLKTDAGKLTAAIIVWKLVGTSLVHLLFACFILIIGMVYCRVMYMRLFTKGFEKVEYSHFGGAFKGTKLIRIPQGIEDLRSDGEWLALWMMIIGGVASIGLAAMVV